MDMTMNMFLPVMMTMVVIVVMMSMMMSVVVSMDSVMRPIMSVRFRDHCEDPNGNDCQGNKKFQRAIHSGSSESGG